MASYTRQSSFSDGDTITAALFNNEYNQLLTAFSYASSGTTGHRHDGTTGEGGHVHTIGDQDFLNKIVADSTNNRWGVFVQVSSSAVEQIRIQDGAIVPVTDNDIDLGTSSLEFKDAYFDGTITTDALTVSSTTNLDGAIQVDNTITVGVDDTGYDVKFFGDTASAYMLWDTSTDDLVLAGAAGIDLAGDIDVDGTANLDIVDIDGAVDMASTLTLAGNADFNGDLDVDGTTNLDAVDIDGAVQIDAAVTVGVDDTGYDVKFFGATASAYMLWDASTDDLVLAGAAGIDLAGDIDVDGTANLDAVDIDGAVQIDGTVTVGVDDTGKDVKFFGATSGSYLLWDESADSLLLTDSTPVKIGDSQDMTLYHDGSNSYITNAVGALKIATETSGIAVTIGHTSSETTVADNLTVTGNASIGGDLDVTGSFDMSDANITNIGSIALDTITNDGTDITLDSSGDIVLDAGGADIFFKDDGTTFGSATNTSGNLIIKSGTTTALTFSGANVTAAGTYTGGGTMTTGGNIVIPDAGNIGSASDTDAIAISSGGVVTMNQIPVFSAGINVSGGTIAGTLATAAQGNVTSLGTLTALTVDDITINGATIYATDLILGEDSQTAIDFGTANEIDFKVDNAARLTLTSGALYPVTDNQIDLGTSSLEFKDAFFDGTVTSDAFAGPLTGDVTGNVSGTAATVTTAAQSNITSLGTLTTLTVDNVIVNGTTIGHTSDTDLITLADGNVTIAGELDLTTLDVSGNIDVDGTTNLDAVDVDGAVNFAADVTYADGADIITASAGTSNFRAGVNAGNSITSGGNYNTVIGDEAGTSLTTGDQNVAVGYAALDAEDTGSGNTGIGAYALTAQDGAGYNTAVGALAGDAITVGDRNVALGYAALTANTVGDRNVAIGAYALYTNNPSSNEDSYNTAVGEQSGYATTTGKQNTFVGGLSGDANTTGDSNVALGYVALSANTEGEQNIAIGENALALNTVGDRSVAIGNAALYTQNPSTNTDMYNVAVGYNAGFAATTGTKGVYIGAFAGDALNTGANNICIGYEAGSTATDQGNNTFIGYTSGQDATSAAYLTSLGYQSLREVTSGSYNTAVGRESLRDTTIGERNTALGAYALSDNIDGHRSVAIGYGTLANSDPSSAGIMYNTAIGYSAGNGVTTGTSNVAAGALSGDAVTTGSFNCSFGRSALGACTEGDNNSTLGAYAGVGIDTGSNNLVLGKDAGRSGSPGGNITTASNEIALGDENISEANIQVDWTIASDERDKTDFTDLDIGLDFVKALEPITYKWDKRSKYIDKNDPDVDLNAVTHDGTHKEDWLDIGFKAQSVLALEEAAGYSSDDKTNLTVSLSGDGKQYGLQYSKFVPILVKAVQELSATVETLQAEINALKEN